MHNGRTSSMLGAEEVTRTLGGADQSARESTSTSYQAFNLSGLPSLRLNA